LISPLFSPFYSRTSNNDQDSSSLSPILLFDEEAFYLFANGYLKVTNPDGSIVTAMQIWSKFLEKNAKFPLKYKVYSFFRDQGYVVKTGVHYGIDFAVYRTTPNRCHSEICAMVVDATTPLNIHDDNPSTCQQGWRHISTLTRVMPDVMKLSVLCYVLPIEWEKQKIDDNKMDTVNNFENDEILSKIFDEKEIIKKEETIWQRMFGRKSNKSDSAIDYSTPSCLEKLTVRPVTSLVRRLVAKSDHYLTMGGQQEKYRKCSILKAPRQERTGKKKRRKRRDHTELRVKSQSKHNKMWKALGQPSPALQTKVEVIPENYQVIAENDIVPSFERQMSSNL
jgi:tRNA-intron lyase